MKFNHVGPWLRGMLLIIGACGGGEDSPTSGDTTSTSASTTDVTGGVGLSSSSTAVFTTGMGSSEAGSSSGDPGTTSGEVSTGEETTSQEVPWECPSSGVAQSVALIDDLEDGNSAIPDEDGRLGGWYNYNDGSDGTQEPPPGGVFSISSEDAHSGTYAARTYGEGFTSWGAALALAIHTTGSSGGGNCPYDASAYDGIEFWAKGQDRVLFHVTTMNTAPVDQGGRCPSASTQCWDDFGTYIELTPQWTRYSILWSELEQRGWGIPTEFSAQEILLLHWQDDRADSFDIWVDDLAFFIDEGGSTGTGGHETSGGSSGAESTGVGDESSSSGGTVIDGTSSSDDGTTGDASTGDVSTGA